ncbi:MAG: ThaI family type II restriction endonuclease [Candidatus Poribacteria bacterium]
MSCQVAKFGDRNVETEMGRENYIKLPKPGTNLGGIEITKEALPCLIKDEETKIIEIF